MKHKVSITILLLSMFLIAQFIGLYVVNYYTPETKTIINPETGEQTNITINHLPKFFQVPEPETDRDFWYYLAQLVPSFVIAIFLILLLTKYKLKIFIRLWFLLVIFIALYLALNSFIGNAFSYSFIIILILAAALAILKIFKPSIIIHNATELLIYPGIAAVFVPILNILTVILLLILISAYDMWAVWKSGIMQKMAKFQMEELKIFGGFLIPYIPKTLREKLNKMKKSKSKKKIKISLAILGGGDVVFPIITAGVFLRTFGFLSALPIVFGAFAGLLFLMLLTKKNKFYPAMPFITAGIFLGALISWLFVI